MSPYERLMSEAEQLERRAERMKGCSWCGDEPPWSGLLRDAADKRAYAMLLAKSKRRVRVKARSRKAAL